MIKTSGAEPVLVLPADLDADIAVEMAKEFAALGAKRLISTRLDMVRRMGGLLKVAYAAKLPLANFSATSKVTDAPSPFNPVSLARLVLPEEALAPSKATATA
jgi:flagellar biosynthesis protein FlhF